MNKRIKVALVGMGMVGRPCAKVLGIKRKDCFDINDEKKWGYDYYILCLPSPTVENFQNYCSYQQSQKIQDLSAIKHWLINIKKHDPKAIVVLRSTVLPGTTTKLAKEYKLNIVHVPEFLTEKTAYKDERDPELLVVGSNDKKLTDKVLKIFLGGCDPKKVIKTNSSTAELIKYTINSFFALKVIFGNQMYDVAKLTRADYGKVWEALESHKWGSKNGWRVVDKGGRGAGGHCLPKDTGVFADTFNVPLLDTMVEINTDLLEKTHKK